MFTGIIEDLGKVETLIRFRDRISLSISTKFAKDMKVGDSICVNGVCLTIADKNRSSFKADVVKETMEKSALSYLKVGDPVNLERALSSTGRFDGHIVLGHVDCRSLITNIVNMGISREISVNLPENFSKYVTQKGSVAVDGISLTIADVEDRAFKVAIVPHTLSKTTLFSKKIGDWVNLEFDVLAKYLEGIIRSKDMRNLYEIKDERIDEAFLKKAGFLN